MNRRRKTNLPVAIPNLPPDGRPASGAAWAVCCLLVLAVWLVFGQTLNHEFVNCDDQLYVTDSPQVICGLTLQGVGWAFTTTRAGNWHPLTWLSLMLDGQFFGSRPWGYHLTSLLLHAAAAILLFLVLWRMTGDLWPAALAAAVFAIHPLRAESVAWVAERKDVLSGLFFMLTLAAYLGYVRRPFSLTRYLLVVAAFALGLMAKPSLVTLPLVLLLLDYWPLGRFTQPRPLVAPRARPTVAALCTCSRRRFRSALALASCVATPLAQGQSVAALKTIPLSLRVSNALVSYVSYLGQFFHPVDLAVFYPYPKLSLAWWQTIAACLVLAGISAVAIGGRRRRPCLMVGWFWFLGMLVPMIGLVQVGMQARADRYTYLPQIGLCIGLIWGLARTMASWPNRRWICAAASTLAVAVLMAAAWRQTAFWRNSDVLWRHALACTARNGLAHHNLGTVLMAQPGRMDEAIEQFQEALAIEPRNELANSSLSGALAMQGRTAEAIKYAEKALAIQPACVDAYNNIGIALAKAGRFDEAIEHFQTALKIQPDYAKARGNIDLAAAMRESVAAALGKRRESIRRQPDNVALLSETAWLLATNQNASIRSGAEAVELAGRAVRLTDRQDATALDALAAAYAETGRFHQAVQTAGKALELARQQHKQALAEAISARIRLYQAGIPFRGT